MKTYRLVNNENINYYLDLTAKTETESLQEALNELGWSVVESISKLDSVDQLVFGFVE